MGRAPGLSARGCRCRPRPGCFRTSTRSGWNGEARLDRVETKGDALRHAVAEMAAASGKRLIGAVAGR
jgi:hypothetical protein